MARNSLEGVRVVDLTQIVSGAVTTMLMADFGADIIKLEPLEGEPYRNSGYPLRTAAGETNLNFLRFSRGKRSVAVDLKSPGGKDVLSRLVAQADVLVENFRPGVMQRLGFDHDALRTINPRLIYTSVSGFGHDELYPSPYGDRPAYAIITEAMAGLMYLAGDGKGPPVWMGFAMADIFAGTLAFAGILLALRDREATGRGRRVDISMYDAALLMNDLPMTAYSVTGEVHGGGQYLLQSPWGPFETTDGYVVIAVLTQPQWEALCDVIGRPDLRDDERLRSGRDRSANHDELVAPAVRAWTAMKSKEECTRLLLELGVPAGPVNTSEEVYASPQASARKMLVDVDDPVMGQVRLVGNPIKMDDAPDPSGSRTPRLGEHTREVLESLLGMAAHEIERLERQGAVRAADTMRPAVA